MIKHRREMTVVLLLVVFLMAVGVYFLRKDYSQSISYLSGDEPHYVMMTDSLVKDGEFNLKNDFELGRSSAYYPAPLPPHVSPLIDKENNSNWQSIHTIGLPILSYVPYKIAGLVGIRVFVILLQLGSLVVFYFILKKYLGDTNRVTLGMALAASCALFWQNLGAIMPDLIILTFWGSAILLFGKKGERNKLILWAILLVAGIVHTKAFLLIGPLILADALLSIKRQGIQNTLREYAPAYLAFIAGVLLYVLFLKENYGVISPTGLYGNNGQLFSANPLTNTIAILTDRSKGILLYAPALLISGPYLYRAFKDLIHFLRSKVPFNRLDAHHYLTAGVTLGLLAFLITQVGFADWSGSTAPNGRYMLPLIASLFFIITKYSNLKSLPERVVLGGAIVASSVLSLYTILHFKYYMSTGYNSFWVDRFQVLVNLPLFGMESSGREPNIRGGKALLVLVIMNIIIGTSYYYWPKLVSSYRVRRG